MEGVLFYWLMLGLLVVGLMVLIIQTIRVSHRPPMSVMEPVGTLLTSWQIARFEPNSEAVRQLFKAVASAHLSTGSLLETIIVSAASTLRLRSKAVKLTLLEAKPISPLAERFLVESGSKSQSIMIGPLSQISAWLDDDKIDTFHHLSLQAGEHGFLALGIASASVHGRSEATKHMLSGLVILEPKIDGSQLLAGRPTRFLTVLPLQFAQHVYRQLFPAGEHFGVNAEELQTLAPRYAEADLAKATVVATADLNARHRVLQSWRHHFSCIYVTTNPEDRDLPPAEL